MTTHDHEQNTMEPRWKKYLKNFAPSENWVDLKNYLCQIFCCYHSIRLVLRIPNLAPSFRFSTHFFIASDPRGTCLISYAQKFSVYLHFFKAFSMLWLHKCNLAHVESNNPRIRKHKKRNLKMENLGMLLAVKTLWAVKVILRDTEV